MFSFGMGWNRSAALAALEKNDDEGTAAFSNGTFASDTVWTKGTGWTIAGGVGVATTATAYITQTVSMTEGHVYQVVYDVTRTVGSVKFASNGGTTNGTARSSSGTFTETFVASASDVANPFGFYGSGFTGTIDNAVITDIT